MLAPTFPPEGPWAAYVWVVIWLPLLFRILFLARPGRRAIAKLAPHAGWALKQLMELPVRGLRLLLLNEVLAFSLPLLMVYLYRQVSDPIGWRTWEEAPLFGELLLLVMAVAWLALDLLRVRRVRKMLLAVERHDVDRLRKVAEVGLGARRLLRKFSGREPKSDVEEKETRPWLSLAKRAGGLALLTRKITPQGLAAAVAWSAAEELARRGAGKLSDRLDEHIEASAVVLVRRSSRTALLLACRDLVMGLLPLLVLALLPALM